MDTSKQNIKMCDCPQIQNRWEPKMYDYVIDRLIGIQHIIIYPCNTLFTTDTNTWYSHKLENDKDMVQEDLIWLPRLDQLLEMLGTKYMWELCNEEERYSIIIGETDEFAVMAFQGHTPEQAVLQGVMHELHGLKWDGKGWIK